LLYRGFLFFFALEDTLSHRLLVYGLMTVAWVLLTTFGFALVTRFSSLMVSAFLVVLAWVLWKIVATSDYSATQLLAFGTQLPPQTLRGMGITDEFDKFVFALNVLLGPSMAIALNTADFGRYGKSTLHIGLAATAGVLFQSLLMMLAGAVLMHAGAGALVEHYIAAGMAPDAAHARVLASPDSIAATFMVFGGPIGFALMLLAQAKAQVLNSYSASLSLANLGDALAGWRPGRFTFVILANVIALVMLYGHLLEFVEAWIRLFGVLLSALAAVIIMDYYVVAPRLRGAGAVAINWAGVSSVVAGILVAHVIVRPYQPVEVLTAVATIACLYPLLRLCVLRPAIPKPAMERSG
jgi:cytosine permease